MAMTSSRPYLLRALYEWIADNDMTPLTVVDATVSGAEVPSAYVEEGRIVLNIGPGAVRNLDIGNDVVTFDARFGGAPMRVRFPSDAVLAIYARENGQGMVFDAPPADAGTVAGDDDEGPDDTPPDDTPPGGGPRLRVVK